jgi:arginine-tRNA-protein transferase
MYHESVHRHGFGKLGALREIALAKEEGYKWWYAGFYIHSCIKMRYKGDYRPQLILDPVSYSWDPLDDDMKKRLDVEKFVSLSQIRPEAGQPKAGTESVTGFGDDETADEDDSDDDAPVPDPDMPLFTRPFPGVLTKTQLLTEIDLDHIKLRIRGQEAETCDLIDWETNDIDSPNSMKGIIAGLVAAVGIELGNEMTVTFG